MAARQQQTQQTQGECQFVATDERLAHRLARLERNGWPSLACRLTSTSMSSAEGEILAPLGGARHDIELELEPPEKELQSWRLVATAVVVVVVM